MKRVLHGISGILKLYIYGDGALEAVNALNAEGLPFWELLPEGDGFSLCCSLLDADRACSLLDGCGVGYETERIRGLPRFIYPYRKRWGLLFGLVIALLIIYFSTTVVWDIRLNCNGDYDEAEVRQALSELGLEVGVPIKGIDVYRTELQFLINNGRFSDIAVNIEGTVIEVELRVKRVAERLPSRLGYYDLVAGEDAVILSVTARRGVPAVKAGDSVKAGQVLIAGLMEGKFGEQYLYRAEGDVKALVSKDYFVSIPLDSTRKDYSGRTEEELTYTVLGRELDLFLDGGTDFGKAEIYCESEPIYIFGLRLPIEKTVVTYREYTIVPERIGEDTAKARALDSLSAYLERLGGRVIAVDSYCVYNDVTDAMELYAVANLELDIGIERLGAR